MGDILSAIFGESAQEKEEREQQEAMDLAKKKQAAQVQQQMQQLQQQMQQLEPAPCPDGKRYDDELQKCMPIVPTLEEGVSTANLSGWNYASCDGEYVYKGEYTAPKRKYDYGGIFNKYVTEKFRLWKKMGDTQRYVVSYGDTEEERSKHVVCHSNLLQGTVDKYTGDRKGIPANAAYFYVPNHDRYDGARPLFKQNTS